MEAQVDFRSPAFLLAHVRHTMAFYDGRCVDPTGGFFHHFKDDGTVYDRRTRHLVSSARFVFNHATAYRRFGEARHVDAVRHGLAFLRTAHAQPQGGYAWQIDWHGEGVGGGGHPAGRTDPRATVLDGTQHCYGLAFVLLAHAHAVMAGVDEAAPGLASTFDLMERHFWEPAHGLYADEATPDWQLDRYRGQNANMHGCEAMLAAFDATQDRRYLERALLLARNVTGRQAALADGLPWEHYREDWSVDWDYNRHDRSNIFRPWGFQTGHLTEWAKLLLQLEARLRQASLDGTTSAPSPPSPPSVPPLPPVPPARPADEALAWIVPRARRFFDTAMQRGWDSEHGGLVYGFAPDGAVCDADKYFWVQAESFAAAALLAVRTGDEHYWQWYDRIWQYAWQHMVDHRHGAWFRILSRDNRKYSDEKSPAGKTDYHTMGACHDVLRALGA